MCTRCAGADSLPNGRNPYASINWTRGLGGGCWRSPGSPPTLGQTKRLCQKMPRRSHLTHLLLPSQRLAAQPAPAAVQPTSATHPVTAALLPTPAIHLPAPDLPLPTGMLGCRPVTAPAPGHLVSGLDSRATTSGMSTSSSGHSKKHKKKKNRSKKHKHRKDRETTSYSRPIVRGCKRNDLRHSAIEACTTQDATSCRPRHCSHPGPSFPQPNIGCLYWSLPLSRHAPTLEVAVQLG